VTSPHSFDRYLQTRRTELDAALEAALPTPPDCPPLIAEAMRYSLFAGGKRLRPILTLAAAEAVVKDGHADGRSRDAGRALAMPAACAVELIHTYSLVHDDLPAMDDDDLRRGRATAHVVYGEGVAILAGDALLTHAFVVLARRQSHTLAGFDQRRLHAIARIAEAAGAAGMVGGQALDLTATGALPEGEDPNRRGGSDEAALREMHERKTGALIGAAATTGAILAGGDETAVTAVDRYATHLGLAFQIVDDILDVEGNAADLGKSAGKDADARKRTYPSVHGLDRSRMLAADAAAAAREALASAGLGGRLAEIADWVVARTS
jgi:geranylgeranyl diphosphate synthase type II